MRITLKRISKKDTYTIGKLYIDNNYFCDTLEDKDRNLYQFNPVDTIMSIKVKGHTAIPKGLYEIMWTYSNRFKRYTPQIMNVPGFDGIRIHSGNTDADTEGCVLLGLNKVVGRVINSRVTCDKFYDIIEKEIKNKKEVWIQIE